jgi:cell division septation protein DedD
MKIAARLAGVLAILLLIIGCSNEQKEEASRLEQEMRQMEDTVADTTPAETAPDTSEMATPSNAGAIPQETELAGLPGRPAGSGYAVQVASCEDESYARYLVGLYAERGFNPYVETYDEMGQTYYRVRLGLFDTLAEARAVKAELADRYSINPWIDQS